MNNGTNNLELWLSSQPSWLQLAGKRLLESGEPDENAICELADLCQQEANSTFTNIDYSIPISNVIGIKNSEEIRLCSISDIAGVNKLAPTNSLSFGDKDTKITVIYGANGSGKSGYVRLLKHICGARDCVRGKLHRDVFSTDQVTQKAKISFLEGDTSKEYKWLGKGICNELRSVDIFDSSFDSVFIKNEGEVCYEPPILSFFSKLVVICDKVVDELDRRNVDIKLQMPTISAPANFSSTDVANWFSTLNWETSINDIEKNCSFTPENNLKLQKLTRILSEQSPTDRVNQLKKKKIHTDSIVNDIQQYLTALSDENCHRITESKKQVVLKELAADTAAENLFESVQLEGIGLDVWKEFWNAARKYSEEYAYKEQTFPVIQNDSVCVLCHQPLSEEAKQKFISFEEYIKGETQKQTIQAKRKAKQIIDALPDIHSIEALKTMIDAAGITDEIIIGALTNTVNALRDRKAQLLQAKAEDDLVKINPDITWIEKVQKISQQYDDEIKTYSQDAIKNNREVLLTEQKNLQAMQWFAEQKIEIQKNVKFLQSLNKIKKAKGKAHTSALSKKKGDLAEQFITEAFVERFNSELEKLSRRKIKVKLIKTNVSKGKVLHALRLDGADRSLLTDVLSEGENRIVSIASFLADVTGKNYSSPFIFDDPISSLDQNYEEAVVQRLCTIASKRQVIIFTHRLSLLGLVQDYANRENIKPEIVCIREESWGTGEPGDIPLQFKAPKESLNVLINQLPKLRNCLQEKGRAIYEPQAKSICSEFRILLERMIEHDLMSDIVQRHRRAVKTMNKIGNLAKISAEDCRYFEELMTKYSSYEHSQSLEAPAQIPDPKELEDDFRKLKTWLKDFKMRCGK